MVLRNRILNKAGSVFKASAALLTAIAMISVFSALSAVLFSPAGSIIQSGLLPGSVTAAAAEADRTGTIGTLKWSASISYTTIMESATAPVYSDGYVFVASGSSLYKYDADTGQLLGTAKIGAGAGRNKLAPTAADGSILVPLKGVSSSSGSSNPSIAIVDEETLDVQTIEYVTDQDGYQSLTPIAYDSAENCAYLGSFNLSKNTAGDYVSEGSYVKVDLSKTDDDNYTPEVIAESDQGFYWSGASADTDFVVFGSKSDGTDDYYTPSDGDAVIYAYSKDSGKLGTITLRGSGSICSSAVYSNGYYYITGKAGRLYKILVSEDEDGVKLVNEQTSGGRGYTALAGTSTCTPQIIEDTAYVGCFISAGKGAVQAINLDSMEVTNKYNTPGDSKFVKCVRDSAGSVKVYATYNYPPGGIYEVSEGYNYFVPDKNMQNYCISSIASADGSDDMLYYTNDSNNLMAVSKEYASFAKPLTLAKPKAAKASKKKVKVSWKPKENVQGYQIARSKYKNKKYTVIKTVSGDVSSVKVTAKRKKNFYYKVRAVRTAGANEIYGDWSAARKFKLK